MNNAIEYLVREEAVATHSDQRMNFRYPFFRPISVSRVGDESVRLFAFSRNISVSDIGLLHYMPLNLGPVILRIPLTPHQQLRVISDVQWCKPTDEGWYLSGVEFIKISMRQAKSLRMAVIKGENERRQQQRHPCFRPVSITTCDGMGTTLSAFSRDISDDGIGLLHSVPLDIGRVMLHVSSISGHDLDISTDIRWCSPVGDGWHISGGKFEDLTQEDNLYGHRLR